MTIADAVLEGIERGYTSRQMVYYLALVNPHVPGTYEFVKWNRKRRELAGRIRRGREPSIVLVGRLPLGMELEDLERVEEVE